jgi:type II secretory pathway component GspD/PulD (secretin)
MATHVIHVEFVPVKDLIEPIRIFMTEGGVIMPYERLNMLILTDYGDSVTKILQIIQMLDNDYLDPDLVDLIKIKYNASADVADDLKKNGGYIPGVRPGQATSDYLHNAMSRITLAGAVFLTVIAIIPIILYREMDVPYAVSTFFGVPTRKYA